MFIFFFFLDKYYFRWNRYGKYKNRSNYSNDSYGRVELKEEGCIQKRKECSKNIQGSPHKVDNVQSKSEVKSCAEPKERTLSPLSCTSSCPADCSHSPCMSCSDCISSCTEVLLEEREKGKAHLFFIFKISLILVCKDFQLYFYGYKSRG